MGILKFFNFRVSRILCVVFSASRVHGMYIVLFKSGVHDAGVWPLQTGMAIFIARKLFHQIKPLINFYERFT